MNLNLTDKVAMVAAASKGLGLAVATALAREGAKVSICGRNAATLEAAEATICQAVPQAKLLAISADVTNASSIEQWHVRTVQTLGPVDILVTNTGGPPAGRFFDLTEAQWQLGMDATIMNVLRMCRHVAPHMKAQRSGRIVHLTSFVSKQPMPLLTISSTLRAGLSALTKTMALELAPYNVLVNAVLPGHFLTDRQHHLNEIRSKELGISQAAYEEKIQQQIPVQRYGKTEELGSLVAFLCSDRSSYITGASIQIDGGLIDSTF